MKRDVVERIVGQLYEMCDFMAILKKTIIDQSSWIEMLMASINEYKGRISRKDTDNGNTQSSINSQIEHFDVSCSMGKNESDVATGIESLNTDQSSTDTSYQPFCLSRSRSSTECDENIVDHREISREDPPQLSAETVTDGREEHFKFSLASHQTSLLDHQENVLRQREMSQASNVDWPTSIDDSKQQQQQQQQHLATDDMCPMCNIIFDSTYDLARRRSHINNHFLN